VSDKEEPLEGERGVAIAGAAIGFVISSALAVYAIVVADNVAVWIRGAFLLVACFFAWLLFVAPTRVRVAIVRWFPWC
jgi:membrane protein YdbS with pleckstrin-like domain